MDGLRELKSLPVSRFDGLARIVTKVEELCVWPEGLLDAYYAMIPKVGGDSTPLGQRPLCVSSCCSPHLGFCSHGAACGLVQILGS